jgi:hypothetical protein
MNGLINQHKAVIKRVSFPITREQLQTYTFQPIHRNMAIENATTELAYIILTEVSGDQKYKRTWTHQPIIRVGNKLSIPRSFISQFETRLSTDSSYTVKITPDILPDVLEKLKAMFVGVGFSIDEFTLNIIVDWS